MVYPQLGWFWGGFVPACQCYCHELQLLYSHVRHSWWVCGGDAVGSAQLPGRAPASGSAWGACACGGGWGEPEGLAGALLCAAALCDSAGPGACDCLTLGCLQASLRWHLTLVCTCWLSGPPLWYMYFKTQTWFLPGSKLQRSKEPIGARLCWV